MSGKWNYLSNEIMIASYNKEFEEVLSIITVGELANMICYYICYTQQSLFSFQILNHRLHTFLPVKINHPNLKNKKKKYTNFKFKTGWINFKLSLYNFNWKLKFWPSWFNNILTDKWKFMLITIELIKSILA